MQEGQSEKAAAKDESYERYDKENQIEGENGREQQLVGLLAADCEKAWLHPGWEDTVLRFL